MLGHLFNRQHRLTHHSTVTALQGCLIYPHYRSLSLQSCPDCSPSCLLMLLSFLTTIQYMMAGIHLDVQLYENLCIFPTEVWQVRSAWNVLDCLIVLLLLRKKILKVFRACGGGMASRLFQQYRPLSDMHFYQNCAAHFICRKDWSIYLQD